MQKAGGCYPFVQCYAKKNSKGEMETKGAGGVTKAEMKDYLMKDCGKIKAMRLKEMSFNQFGMNSWPLFLPVIYKNSQLGWNNIH